MFSSLNFVCPKGAFEKQHQLGMKLERVSCICYNGSWKSPLQLGESSEREGNCCYCQQGNAIFSISYWSSANDQNSLRGRDEDLVSVLKQESEAQEPYCCAVKVHHKCLHGLSDVCSHVECVGDHTEVDICRIIFVIYCPRVEVHSSTCYCTHSKVIFSCDTCRREKGWGGG